MRHRICGPRSDFDERQQGKGALQEPRMRHLQVGGVKGLVQDPEQVQVQSAWAPVNVALAPGHALDVLGGVEQSSWGQRRVQANRCVEVIGLNGSTYRRVLVDVRDANDVAQLAELFERPCKSTFSLAEIRSNTKNAVRGDQHDPEPYPMAVAKQPVPGLARVLERHSSVARNWANGRRELRGVVSRQFYHLGALLAQGRGLARRDPYALGYATSTRNPEK